MRSLDPAPGEIGDIEEPASSSPASPFSPPPQKARIHPVPEDSIIADAIRFNRACSEAPDSFTVAPLLCLAGRLLTPGCYWHFAGIKYPNLFNFVVGPPGIRKSTSFGLAEQLAKHVLPESALHEGSASDSALFERFEAEPHMLQIEDEGNTLLEYWNRQGVGKELASRYLKLYDGKSWSQTFRNQANSNGGAHRRIARATLSFALGGTPNTAKFAGINNASGLRRRFGYYVALRTARRIAWPEAPAAIDSLAEAFQDLSKLSGVFRMSDEARLLWAEIHAQFSDALESITSFDAVAEAKQAALSEAASRTVKLAGIFEAARWAKTKEGDGLTIRDETLQIAFEHQKACLDAADEMETIGRRAAIEEQADVILAGIRTDSRFSSGDDWHTLTRSELTSKFANNSGRAGSLTVRQLYDEIVPNLITRGLCRRGEKVGRLERYLFAAETTGEL
ncbi:DUF3987 domain-containing protein [Haloferula helveola]|uniref:DUF3987 domain-containing protein n=1 Tax=Haloferula helveola TaxID=490095 RepID=UPI0030CA608F